MIIYVSAWNAKRGTTAASGHKFFNYAKETHPLAELKERRLKYPEDDWVLLWFHKITVEPDDYFAQCSELNGGEMMDAT